jgi:alpha-glucosidase
VIDFTNPQAAAWFGRRILRENMLGIGMAGWMADFGEYLPTDVVLADGDPMLLHNAWPVLWARVNAEAIGDRDAVFFMRSGYTGSQAHCPLLWGGDQCVDFSRHDGLGTVICGALSAGLVGNAAHHSDIGGYTSLFGLVRTPELLARWIDMAAFTPVMRTHEGNRPCDNLQVDSDAAVLAHFARMTRVHVALAPYVRAVLAETGLPAQRPLFLHFPHDAATYTIPDAYSYGRDLLVAPVHRAGAETWPLYLPRGADWVHLWSGARFGGGREATVPAPIGQPPVFWRDSSAFAALFERVRAEWTQ